MRVKNDHIVEREREMAVAQLDYSICSRLMEVAIGAVELTTGMIGLLVDVVEESSSQVAVSDLVEHYHHQTLTVGWGG